MDLQKTTTCKRTKWNSLYIRVPFILKNADQITRKLWELVNLMNTTSTQWRSCFGYERGCIENTYKPEVSQEKPFEWDNFLSPCFYKIMEHWNVLSSNRWTRMCYIGCFHASLTAFDWEESARSIQLAKLSALLIHCTIKK